MSKVWLVQKSLIDCAVETDGHNQQAHDFCLSRLRFCSEVFTGSHEGKSILNVETVSSTSIFYAHPGGGTLISCLGRLVSAPYAAS